MQNVVNLNMAAIDMDRILLGVEIRKILLKIDKCYNEKEHYNFDTRTCATKKCGHYTQVVKANSRYVGCAFRRCPDKVLTICNYSAGNLYSSRPHTKGPACSKCASGAGWCKNKLCNWQCTRA